ncbi:MAG TPA: carboxypeptidase regulatory-like domain-containing protein [Longimicrobiales bacterium]|nr:carboxypeptidase regulatory-like domain-containing protein [Longimicrobiales bacterium]
MRRAPWFLTIPLLLLPADMAAQTVLGTVRDAAAVQPLSGVFVTVRNDAGRTLAGVLTDSLGRFLVRGLAAGTYQLHAARIGYDSTLTAPFRVDSNESKSFELQLAVLPFRLSEVAIRAERQCAANPQRNAELARLWEEARKALRVAAWMSTDSTAQFRIRRFERELDRGLRPVGDEIMSFDAMYGQRAFSTLPADSLAEFGFMQRDGDVLNFFGPDADVLLDPLFLAQHCFRVTRERDRPGMVGLAFEPMRGRDVPDIEGVLWIDEASGALRSIDYQFTNLGFRVDSRYARGRTVYEQLANGAWIVRSWELRMPNVALAGGRGSVEGAHETGAEVLDVMLPGGSEIALVPSFAVRGTAFDSVRGQPLARARAFLAGTPFEAVTDERGSFVLERVPQGTYYLQLEHPRLDSLPVAPPALRVRIDATTALLTITTPGARTLRDRYCPTRELNRIAAQMATPATELGVLRVRVLDAPGGTVVAGVHVQASWQRGAAYDARFPAVLASTTNADGIATLCGLPRGVMYQLTIGNREHSTELPRLVFPAHGVLQFTAYLVRGRAGEDPD